MLSTCGPVYLDYNFTSDLIHLLFAKKNISTQNNIFTNFKPKLLENYNQNIIFNFCLLIKNLDDLLIKLKDLNVNAGPRTS